MWRITLTALFAILIWLIGFGTGCVQSLPPKCPQYAIASYLTAVNNGYKARLLVGPTSNPAMGHVQAQAYIDGQWVWLRTVLFVEAGAQDGWYTPSREVSLSELLTMMKTE